MNTPHPGGGLVHGVYLSFFKREKCGQKLLLCISSTARGIGVGVFYGAGRTWILL
jgi:hypothetical protein